MPKAGVPGRRVMAWVALLRGLLTDMWAWGLASGQVVAISDMLFAPAFQRGRGGGWITDQGKNATQSHWTRKLLGSPPPPQRDITDETEQTEHLHRV